MRRFYTRPSGDLSARVFGVKRILRKRAAQARVVASTEEHDSQFAASLRGKAKGYDEAADLIERLDKGRTLPTRRWYER